MAGVRFESRNPDADRSRSDGRRRRARLPDQSDFPLLFETALHKILQAAYATTPDTWSRSAAPARSPTSAPTNRYLKGTFGALDQVNEHGEFKNKIIPILRRRSSRRRRSATSSA
jgi:hypothetical protein